MVKVSKNPEKVSFNADIRKSLPARLKAGRPDAQAGNADLRRFIIGGISDHLRSRRVFQ